MTAVVWERLSGSVLGDRFELRDLMRAGARSAVFAAVDKSDSQQVLVQVFQAQDEAERAQFLSRFQEAAYLRHSNLMPILAQGRDPATELVFAVSPLPEKFLTHTMATRPILVESAREFTSNLRDAFAYLHSEGLVYCNLRADSVCRLGGNWRLADFSQLRLPSHGDGKDLRQTMARNAELPPEAFNGVVSPAWDVWSLGLLLRYALTADYPGASRGRQLRGADLPAPFDTIVRDCLEPDPAARITLDEIGRRLNEESAPVQHAPIPPEAPRVERAFGLPGIPTRSNLSPNGVPKVQPATAALLAVAGFALTLAMILGAAALMGYGGTPGAPTSQPEPITEADRMTPEPTPVPPARATAPIEAEIRPLLNQWVESTRARDIDGQVDCYAPRVKVYFGRTNMTREQVRQDKGHLFETIGTVHQFDIGNVQIRRADPDTAVALFDKTWEFGDSSKFAGAERGQLTFEKFGGEWKIVGERELKVYWVRRPGGRSRNRST